MKKILVPVDGSKLAKKAGEVAKDLALKYDSDIILVTVVSSHEFLSQEYRGELLAQKMESAEKILLEAKKDFEDMGDRVETHCLKGDIANEILICANREQVDLIVMGSRGLGAFTRTLLGSVSNKILNHSEVSVLIVK